MILCFVFNDTATTEIYTYGHTLSLHDARPIYNKGAEVIRMMATILGPEAFRAATDLYFDRFDGTAATCDDFVDCMEEAGGVDLTQFRLWYSQAGTPRVVAGLVDQPGGRVMLTLADRKSTRLHSSH